MNKDENGRDENGRDENGRDEEAATDAERSRGFRLELGVQPLTDLLGALIELDVSEPPPSKSIASRPTGRPRRGAQGSSGAEQDRETRDGESGCRIDTRVDDNAFVVVADIPGASREDVSAGIDPRTNELVISREGTVLGRVEIPLESPEATRAWFNNGVLEVRLRSRGA